MTPRAVCGRFAGSGSSMRLRSSATTGPARAAMAASDALIVSGSMESSGGAPNTAVCSARASPWMSAPRSAPSSETGVREAAASPWSAARVAWRILSLPASMIFGLGCP
jgi:hypothetical protein